MNKIEELENKLKEEKNKMQANLKENYKWVVGKYVKFEEYKKFLSDPDQKKFCFKGYYYVEVKEQDDKELLGAMGRVVYE